MPAEAEGGVDDDRRRCAVEGRCEQLDDPVEQDRNVHWLAHVGIAEPTTPSSAASEEASKYGGREREQPISVAAPPISRRALCRVRRFGAGGAGGAGAAWTCDISTLRTCHRLADRRAVRDVRPRSPPARGEVLPAWRRGRCVSGTERVETSTYGWD